MNRYIREIIWQKGRDREKVLVASIRDTDTIVGFGAWKHVVSSLPGDDQRVIRVPYFGVDAHFQGEHIESGESCADTLYSSLEADAVSHPDSSPEMQIELFCDTENERGLRFWSRQGFQVIGTADGRSRDGQYYRMRR